MNDSVLPRRAWLDVQRVGSAFFTPLFHHFRDEITSIVAANISWRATYHGQLVKHHNHIVRLQLAGDFKRNIFPRVFVQHHQHLDWPAIRRSIKNKIQTPHFVLARRLLANNARFRGSNSSFFSWDLSNFQTFLSTNMPLWFVIHAPTFMTQQVLRISPTTSRMLAYECAQPYCKVCSICVLNKFSQLHASMLTNHATCCRCEIAKIVVTC